MAARATGRNNAAVMYVNRRYPLRMTLAWSKERFLFPFAWALLVTVLHVLFPRWPLLLPALPVTLIGTAVAFYLGFRNSSSYGRLWEARQIWGGIVNASRSWAVATRDLVVAAP
ncbi:MAG: bestrophin family ion channel, partial [Planctomycetota bacterium]